MTEDTRTPEEIERDVAERRARLDETLDAIQERLSPRHWIDEASEFISDGNGGDLMRNVGTTVRDNPVPLLLVGAGLAWLAASALKGDRERQRDDASHPGDVGIDPLDEAASYGIYPEPLHDPYDPDFDPILEASAPGAYPLDPDLAEHEHSREAGTHEGSGSPRERAKVAAAEARARAERAARRASTGATRMRRYGSRTGRRAWDYASEHPWPLGAIGLAVGVAIAAALPRSRREDAWMGESSERVRRHARDRAGAEADRVRAAAEAAYRAGVQKAREEGLTASGAKRAADEAVDELKSKASHVADAAREAAEGQADRSETEAPVGVAAEGEKKP